MTGRWLYFLSLLGMGGGGTPSGSGGGPAHIPDITIGKEPTGLSGGGGITIGGT